ncbi:DUF3216 domain-containing protein [Thermococcus sp.]
MNAVDELKRLCAQLNEDQLISVIDSFTQLNKELESKKGREFTELSILSFVEGILITLRQKYPKEQRISELLKEVQSRRMELDKKPKMSYLER